jgi:uncharacterized membrane-anchored protein YhcB (DUF1043 family)
MKLATINMIVGILAGIKLNKITDKRVKTTLVNDYLHLRKFVREAESDRQSLVDKFQEDWADELDAINALRQDGKKVVGHDAYLEAEKDTNKAISDIFAREVEVSIKPLAMDEFMTACSGEELTIEQLAFLQEAGIVE